MTTGIYLLTFAPDAYYIGQSVDIENRWKQHYDKLCKGTAARPMQIAFNKFGIPKAKILLECHKDHLDMMEGMFITSNQGPGMLNTSIPKGYTDKEIKIACASNEDLKMSTVQILARLRTYGYNIDALENEVNSLRNEGIVLSEELEKIKEKLYKTAEETFKNNKVYEKRKY